MVGTKIAHTTESRKATFMTRKLLIQRAKAILLRRRDALRRSLSGELAQYHTFDRTIVGDSVDFALDAEYAEINSELAETEGRELDQVERALGRLREGCYGMCECCGRMISLARLRAIPHATMCTKCRILCEQGIVDLSRTEPVTNSSAKAGLKSRDIIAQFSMQAATKTTQIRNTVAATKPGTQESGWKLCVKT